MTKSEKTDLGKLLEELNFDYRTALASAAQPETVALKRRDFLSKATWILPIIESLTSIIEKSTSE